jgi:hypothetical protein
MTLDQAKTKNGSFTFDNVDYTLLQQAYSENNQNVWCGYSYVALAKKSSEWDNEDADQYMVKWIVIDTDCDDESNACDWNYPIEVKKI